MTGAERALRDKAWAGQPVTVEDKLAVIVTVADVEHFAAGLVLAGIAGPEAVAACARRKAEIQRGMR